MDATIISAPSSTKNQSDQRDPRCTRPIRAINESRFRMKMHIGVDECRQVYRETSRSLSKEP